MHRCFLKFLHGHQGGRGSQVTHVVPQRGSEPVSISIHDPHEWQQITAHTHRDTRTGMVRSPTLTRTPAVAVSDSIHDHTSSGFPEPQRHLTGMQFRAACFTGLYNLRRKTVHLFKVTANRNDLRQGSSNLFLEGQSAAEFSSNPDQTHYLWFSNDLEDSD